MKLYATVHSERATKGLGGDEDLTILLFGTDRKKPLARLCLWQYGRGYQLIDRYCVEILPLSPTIEISQRESTE